MKKLEEGKTYTLTLNREELEILADYWSEKYLLENGFNIEIKILEKIYFYDKLISELDN